LRIVISFAKWCLTVLCAFGPLPLSVGIPLFAGAPQQVATPLAAKAPASAAHRTEQALEEALKKQRASFEKQRQAIERQLSDRAKIGRNQESGFIDLLPALSQADCPALDSNRVDELVSTAAQKQSLDPALLRAVIKQESGFKPCAVSVKGAQGLMQLMPGTARELHVADVFDPQQNVQGGAAYLKQMLARYKGDLRLALVGYNAGPGRADQSNGMPYPAETQDYIANIFADLGLGQPDSPAEQEEEIAPSQESDETAPAADDAIKPIDTTAPSSPSVSEKKMNPAAARP